jgi:hypothetical protein
MMTLLERIPWKFRALLMWGGVLTGIGIVFLASNADWAAQHSWQESVGVLTGWFTAFGSALVLMLSKSPWDE